MEEFSPGTMAAIGGLIGGIGLGFAARWGNFCTLGAIEDAIFGSNYDRLFMWAMAIGVAIIGTFALDYAALVDISVVFYLARPTTIIATFVGAIVFGVGMSLVGTCGFGALARVGGGDLKSFVTFLVMGISAYATLSGATAYLRVGLFPEPAIPDQPAGIAHFISDWLGGSIHHWAFFIAAIILASVLLSKTFRTKRRNIITGLLLGLIIIWGWVTTGILAVDEFDPVPFVSFTFSAPLGQTIMYIMTMTGATLSFGVGATAGIVVGAAITSISQGHFRWEACDDARELRRQIIGGLLMGVGGVTAFGCTVGQGMSAFSTLAFSAPIALVGIFLGAWAGLHFLVHGSISEAFAHLMATGKGE